MTREQENRFFDLCDGFRRLGYVVLSEPLEGMQEAWLNGLRINLSRVEKELTSVNKAYRTRGRSKAALYHLTAREWFDPGFGIHVSAEQTLANRSYKRAMDRAVERYNAANAED
jgi:hypothetical protein